MNKYMKAFQNAMRYSLQEECASKVHMIQVWPGLLLLGDGRGPIRAFRNWLSGLKRCYGTLRLVAVSPHVPFQGVHCSN